MPVIAEWDVANPAVWMEVLNGQVVMLRHPTYPAEASWAGQNPEALRGIAADYLRRVGETFGLLDLFDSASSTAFNEKKPLAWLPFETDATSSPRMSFLFARRRPPSTAGDPIDRTAIILAVESSTPNDAQVVLGSRLGIRIAAHISAPGANNNNVRITGATCSAGLQAALSTNRHGPFASQITAFFSRFFSDAEFVEQLKRDIRAAAGLSGESDTWIDGVRIRGNTKGGPVIDVYVNVPSPDAEPLGVARALTATIVLDGKPFSVASVETFPLLSDAGMVHARLFRLDPASQQGFHRLVSARPNRSPRRLERFRRSVTLPDLTLDASGNVDLVYSLVKVARSRLVTEGADENLAERIPHPWAIPHARKDAFAALSGYRRAHSLFDTMIAYGLSPATYFRLASLPLIVRYRAPIRPGPGKDGKTVNAQVSYNPPGCSLVGGTWSAGALKPLQVRFAMADLQRSGSRRQPLGLAADPRWSWHEYGHVLLAASTGALELPFAHSTGDALAAILCDPRSRVFRAPEGPSEWMRGYTFPWVYLHRRHDRSVFDGWSWSGRFHRPARFDSSGNNCRHKSYQSEQILSTSLFRLYRALGGDTLRETGSPAVRARQAAADYCAYLIMRAIGLLGPSTWVPAATPDQLVSALIDADIATWPAPSGPLEGRVGGWAHKVVRWAFEAQGLYATTDPLDVVDAPGMPPDVDVFIDNRRPDSEGDFPRGGYMPVSLDLRTAPWQATTDAVHVQGSEVSVQVRNRGASQADDTVVEVWWADSPDGDPLPKWDRTDLATWTRLAGPTTARTIPPWPTNPPETFQPFTGLPNSPSGRRLLILAAATCPADRANNDPATGLPCGLVPTRVVDLAAGDNNLGLRIYTVP